MVVGSRGANINVQCAHYGNALQAVSIKGPREGGTALIGQGHCGQTREGGECGGALQVTMAGGHAGVIELKEGLCAICWAKAESPLVGLRFSCC